MNKSFLASLVLASIISANAQEAAAETTASPIDALKEEQVALKGDLDGLKEGYTETKNTVDKLAKFKISGYTQFQYRYAVDTVANANFAIGDFAGGNLYNAAGANNVNGIFAIRRGRVKIAYKDVLSSSQAEFEILPSGVGLKDLEFAVIDPWTKSIGARVGVMDRPFGYEVGYSSSNLEIAERSRMVQVLFPGEKDLGAQIFWEADDNAPALLQHITLNGGLYSGFGGTSVELADNKDFIGHVALKFPIEAIGAAVDGGFSYYKGIVRATNDTSYSLVSKAWTSKVSKDPASYNHDRKYMGFDGQVYYDVPFVGGLSLRGEYIKGQQPGSSSNSDSPKGALPTKVYDRNFAGFYGQATLNVGTYAQLAFRHDVFDPNTDVEEADFKAGVKLNAGDVAYTTNSLGLSLFVNANTKVAFYYDMVSNEKVGADVKDAAGKVTAATINKQLTRDLPDNVLNIRLQYKF